ncbi:MAG: site-specific integrase [Pseudomonadota bacterium]
MKPRNAPPRPILDTLSVLSRQRRRKPTLDALSALTGSKSLPATAPDDYAQAVRFLLSYDGSSATFNAYRRELERLLQWCWLILKRPAIFLDRDAIETFVKFSLSPPVAWIGTKQVARFRDKAGERVPNPDWRPYVVSRSKASNGSKKALDPADYVSSQPAVRATFTALSSFYDYLTDETLIPVNPVSLIRQKSKFIRKDQNQALVRRISNLQWDYVLETAEKMANDDPITHERTLFVMSLLFGLYLRISELVADERSAPVMGDFRKDLDGNWWFHVTGKGNKDRTITVSGDVLSALQRYRAFLDLSPLPLPNEPTPLVRKVRGQGPVTSSRWIRKLVQTCFDEAYKRMCKDGLLEDAGDLKLATVHWLRHTGISEDVKTRPREHVRDDAGHASMATTDRYIESDRRERHYSGRNKPLKEL